MLTLSSLNYETLLHQENSYEESNSCANSSNESQSEQTTIIDEICHIRDSEILF